MKTHKADVAIIGGSFGAISAAITLLRKGHQVILTDEYAWVGGQVTSQGLCVLDDLNVGEVTGCSRLYSEFRQRVRDEYTSQYKLSAFGKSLTYFSPGNARCSRLAAEPHKAHQAILLWFAPYLRSGQLQLFTQTIPVSAKVENKKIVSVQCKSESTYEEFHIEANFFLDGSDTGELLPLLKIPFYIGSESKSEFNEPHAPEKGNPLSVQSFTFCILAEFYAGGSFVIPKPVRYEYWKSRYRFYLSSAGTSVEEPADFFRAKIRKDGIRIVPFWNYRSVVDPKNFEENQGIHPRTCINVASNDYCGDAYV